MSKNVLTSGNKTYVPEEIGEFSEGYALAKICETDKNDMNHTYWTIIDENYNIVGWADDSVYNLVSHYEPISDYKFNRIAELKKSANLGKFTNGVAKIEISADLYNSMHDSHSNVLECYYITRSGLVLSHTDEINGKAQAKNKKEIKQLEFALEIWNNPNKFRKIRVSSGFDRNSLISKVWDKNIMNIILVRAFFDIANQSLDEKYKQAEKDLNAGLIGENDFEAKKNKILSTARKNHEHLFKHERRSGTIEGSHHPTKGLVDQFLLNEGYDICYL